MLDRRKFNGTAISSNAWSATEDAVLRRCYEDPKISWDELASLLPKRSKPSISKRASDMGLHRRRVTRSSNLRVVRRLWELREREGITRAELAKKMGYHEVMLARWERGDANPSLQKLVDWCQALGAELTATYRGSPLEPQKPHDDDDFRPIPILEGPSL